MIINCSLEVSVIKDNLPTADLADFILALDLMQRHLIIMLNSSIASLNDLLLFKLFLTKFIKLTNVLLHLYALHDFFFLFFDLLNDKMLLLHFHELTNLILLYYHYFVDWLL